MYLILLGPTPQRTVRHNIPARFVYEAYARVRIIIMLGVIAIFSFFKKSTKQEQPAPSNIYNQMNGLLHIIPGNAQHIGAREEQQDSFLFSDMENPELVARIGVLAVLADGMGGLQMGREASCLAVRTFLVEYCTKTPEETIPDELKRAAQVANGAVFDMATRANLAWNTGTTLIAAVIDLDELYWISVGDSRIYLFRDQHLSQLNRDHNYSYQLQAQVAQGILTQEEADLHPERNALTSYLGMDVLNEIDQNLQPINLKPGDRILLCSDGLHGVLSPEEMIQCLSLHAQEAAELLLNETLAKSLRHQDNVTVAILACE